MLDIGQTKLIILGKEKMLTLVDHVDRTVTVPRPIERVVSLAPDATKAIVALGECDKLVGVSTSSKICLCYEYYDSPERAPICTAKVCGGRLFELPEIRSYPTINEELIVSLEPDVIIPFAKDSTTLNVLQEKTGIPVVGLSAPGGYTLFEYGYNIIECMGTLLEKEEDAEEMISFVEEKLDEVREVTSQIPEEEKPKIYIVSRCEREVATTVLGYDPLDAAGGTNVAKGAGEAARDMSLKVSKEQIIAWNPDIILIFRRSLKTEVPITIESVLSDPDLQSVDAVKNESVYYSLTPHCSGKPLDRILANTMYLAKLLHPDKFEDLDVEEEGNEIFKRFLGVDGLFSEYADYTIWLREWLDSQK
jgi:iron complex transport system substrate-binding protein